MPRPSPFGIWKTPLGPKGMKEMRLRLWQCCLLHLMLTFASGQTYCDWPKGYDDLQVRCACTSSDNNQRRSIHCTSANFNRLVAVLANQPPLDLLVAANSSVDSLADGVFSGLDIRSIQLPDAGLKTVSPSAFQGLERILTSLSLDRNELREVPSVPLKRLTFLKMLDLSYNRISELENDAFNGLSLTTLKLSDNPLKISDAAFHGLETTLHNLNLKGTGQTTVPKAVKQLSQLSFLDMSQNKISELLPNDLSSLTQLTALTFERNMISSVHAQAFLGLNTSLSSLSLLNNKIEEFPTQAVRSLTQLRVLDLGFNRMKSVPEDSFKGNSLLTLLALDGNPLTTLSEKAFLHLNSTLRGLSIGSSTLVCDCKLRWIVGWIKTYDLQVTSRERNPRFCGRPLHLRRRSFPQLSPSELKCDSEVADTISTTATSTASETTIMSSPPTSVKPTPTSAGPRDFRSPRTAIGQIRLLEVTREGSDINIRWDHTLEEFRGRPVPLVYVMYRIFGETHFRKGTSVSPSARRVQVNGIPEDKPLVVCLVENAQAATLSRESVPHSQCDELIPEEKVVDSQLNTIIIGSSAAVCGMIVIAVIIFVCCSRKSRRQTPIPRPTVKSEHEWETSSLYSGRSIPRARAYHGTINHSYLHDPRVPDDVQSFRSLPATRVARNQILSGRDLHNSNIALSQLSGHHSFLGSYGEHPNPGWNGHWENGDIYSERPIPSRLSYAKDNNYG